MRQTPWVPMESQGNEPAALQALAAEHFIWDGYVGGVPRLSAKPLMLSPELHAQAVATAEAAVRVLGAEVGRMAWNDAQERAAYGFAPDVERLMRASHLGGPTANLSRVDLLLGEDGAWHVCEVNADCPGGHNEAFALPLLARRLGFGASENPTSLLDATVDRLVRMGDGAVALLLATAYAEDLQVCAFLRRALRNRGVVGILAPPTALRYRRGALEVYGTRVTALYRYFPTEYMEGQENLGELERALLDGAVESLSGFDSMFLQSKTVMGRAWARRAELFPQDRAFIENHVPETYDALAVPRDVLVGYRSDWVLKRALGRVGDEVFVGEVVDARAWAPVVDEVRTQCALGDRWIAQRFVPQAPVSTPWGERLVTLGAYVLDGKFAGYFTRLSQKSHVSHDALVVPVLVGGAS